MELLTGPAVLVLNRDEAAVLSGQLVEALRLAYVARGRPPPRHLLDFANEVSRVARGFAGFPASAQVNAPRETATVSQSRSSPGCGQPDKLTATEAAAIAGVSVQYMRSCLRRGDPAGSRQGGNGAWLVGKSELAAWVSERRKEVKRKAA